MSENDDITRNLNLSFVQLLWRRFTAHPLNMAGLLFVGLLALVAILAPFLANDKPMTIRIQGRWRLPLLHSLRPADVCLLLVPLCVLLWFVLVRRLSRRKDTQQRRTPIWPIVTLCCALIVVATVLSAAIPQRIDAIDYAALIASGEADLALSAPIPHSPARTDLPNRQQPPSRTHLLGTDDVGADVLSRLIHGTRVSLAVGLLAVGISTAIGIAVGAALGYFGGKVDFVGLRLIETASAIPVLLLTITILAFCPRSLLTIATVIGVTHWTTTARLVRAEFLRLRHQDFVQAAVALGLPARRIIARHMLPNAMAPVLVNATFSVSAAIFIEAALSFLGFGIAPPTPSWGRMLSQGLSTSGQFIWWLTLFPGVAIFLTVLAYNLIGQGLRDALDPQQGRIA